MVHVRTSLNVFLLIALLWFKFGCSGIEDNPLLKNRKSPIQFESINAMHIQDATDEVLRNANHILSSIYDIKPANSSFNNILLPLDNLRNEIENVWSPISLLSFTHPDKEIRESGFNASQKIEEYLNRLSVDEKLFNSIQKFSKSTQKKILNDVEKKFLHDTLRDFRRSGFGHDEHVRDRVKILLDRLTSLGLQFEKNISEGKDTLFLNESELTGLSEDYILNRKLNDGRIAIDLSYPSYNPFMKYAENDSIRKSLRFMFWNRAVDKNISILDSLIYYRNILAKTLQYPSFADYRTEILMSENPNNVWEFEKSLREKIMSKALADYDKMLAIKSKITGKYEHTIESWEYARYEHLLLREKFRLDSKLVSEYFELSQVISGLFEMCETLFGLEFREILNPSVWHDNVFMYEMYDREDEQLIGRFYLDLFPRENKYSHAAAFSITMGKLVEDHYQIPAMALVCNFPAPTDTKPSLLSHDDVETFFHEFGHLLHGLLTTSPFHFYSGTSVLQDFVEAPSQIFENWVWEKEILKRFARHYETGEVIPDKLIQKLIAAKNVNSGVKTLQQIFYGVFDFTIHNGFDPFGDFTTTDIAEILQNEITLYPYLDHTHMHASFGHLVGYESAYYGYLWSKVYAQDMYSVFKKNGILDSQTGRRYREIIFEPGGTIHPKKLVRKFLGREPNMDAFLMSLGIQND
jgi:thimet oligopeptidase